MTKADNLNDKGLSHPPKAVVSYATLLDLQQRFGKQVILEMTDRNHDGSPDVDFVNMALADTDGIINGYLASGGYSIGSGINIPPQIKAIACDIAFYRLHTDPTESATGRYKEAVRLLERIADGKHKIDMPKNLDSTVVGDDNIGTASIVQTGRRDWRGQR